jgi:hypothetical protein
MGEEKCDCIGGAILSMRALPQVTKCKRCHKFKDDNEAAEAVWSLWEQTHAFLALGDDESAESFGKMLDEAGSKL